MCETLHILIDRSSIKRNPNGGRNSYFVSGQINPDGSRSVQMVHTLTPEPHILYKYHDTEIKCEECGSTFLHTANDCEDFDDCGMF